MLAAVVLAVAVPAAAAAAAASSPLPAFEFTVNSSDAVPLPHVWQHVVGSGHAALTLRPDWRAAVNMSSRLLGVESVRFHGLFDDSMGPVVTGSAASGYAFNFTAIDSTYDFLLAVNMTPYVELSFMPTALARAPADRYLRYNSCTSPPASLSDWYAFIAAFARHLVERYGADVVTSRFRFEVWNEPNLSESVLGTFWSGTQQEYFDLFNATATALKSVHTGLRVLGPASSGGGWLQPFLAYTTSHGVPLDGVSTHHYPSATDWWSLPKDVDRNLATVAANDGGAGLPLVVSEYNSGLLNPLLFHNHDSPFAAAYVAWLLPVVARHGVAVMSYWCVSDVFDEIARQPVRTPFHDGYGLITMQNVPKPAFRALQLLGEAGDVALGVVGPQPPAATVPPVNVSVSTNAARSEYLVIVTNFQLWATQNGSAVVNVTLPAVAMTDVDVAASTLRRVDDSHANPRAAWVAMGKPQQLTAAQLTALNTASELRVEPAPLHAHPVTGAVAMSVTVPREGLAAIAIAVHTPS